MADIRDDDGLTPVQQSVDQTIEGTIVSGENGPDDGFLAPAPARPAPQPWEQVDPTYEGLVPEADDAPENVDEETLDEEDPEGDTTGATVPVWVSYEVEGRDLDEVGADWQPYISAPLDTDTMAAVIPDLPTAVRMEFRMRLTDSQGRHSAWTTPATITTPRDFTPPPRPIGLWVDSKLGFTNAGWGGELEGPFPGDFSHTLLYTQQMHPEGNPDGQQGDPIVRTRFNQRSSWGLGFLPFAEHRAFLTSVDTSGNESPRSEYVYFTPTPPVNAEQIRADLDEARERLEQAQADWDEAREALEAGLVDLNEVRLPAVEQNLASAQAAVEEAGQRLEAAEENISESQSGLSDLRDNVLPGLREALDGLEFSIEDYDARIQQAQAGADQARATAETLRDDTLPALEDRLVDNEQALDEAEGRITDVRLVSENLRDVRFPGLQDALNSGLADANQWRNVDAISASSLRVGNWESMILDPEFEDRDYWHTVSPGLSFGASVTRSGVTRRVVIASHPHGVLNLETPTFRCEPGQEYLVEFIAESGGSIVAGGGVTAHWCGIRWLNQDGSHHSFSSERLNNFATATAWVDRSLVARAPAGARYFRAIWRVEAPYRDARVAVAHPRLRRRGDANLLVDGSVGARHVMAEEVAGAVGQFLHLSADQIDTVGLAAYLATIIELDAGQITSGRIDTSRINAEEMAAAVANFLTLDALEINFEQLAGEIADIIQVTAESISAGSIRAHHMAISSTDNLWRGETDMSEHNLSSRAWSVEGGGQLSAWGYVSDIAQGGAFSALRVSNPTGYHRIIHRGSRIRVTSGDPYLYEQWARIDSGGFASTAWNQVGAQFVWLAQNGSIVSSATHSVSVSSAGNKLLRVNLTPPAGAYWLEIRFVINATGNGAARLWPPSFRHMESGKLLVDGLIGARHVMAEEVAGAIGRFLELHADQLVAGQIDTDLLNVGDLAARIATVIELNADRLIADSVTAREANFSSWFADTGFLNTLRAAVVEAIEITAERGFIGGALLEDSTITVEKLYALDEIMSELGRFLRIEAGQLASNVIEGMIIRGGRIEGQLGVYGELQIGDRFTGGPGQGGIALRSGQDPNGTILGWDFAGLASLRFGGRNNYLAGEFYAKTAENSGTLLSSGDVTYREGYNTGSSWGLTYRNRTSTGPYLKLLRDGVSANNSPTFVWDEATNELVLAPFQSGSGADSTVSIPSTLDVERLLVEGNTRIMGNLNALGTIGTYNSITLAGTYTHNRPCFYRQIGNVVFLGGAVNSHAQNRFGGSIAQLPAPSSTRQLTTARTNSAGGHDTMPVQIATNGWMTVPGGAQIESGTPMSLDGLFYLTG